MPAGRPSKFNAKYVKELIEFFSLDPYRRELAEHSTEYFATGKLKRKSEKFRYTPNKLPTLFGFARKIKVAYSTVWRWAEKGESDDKSDDFKEFCNAYKEAKELQKEFLISIGLVGAASAPFAIFTAKNVTDMRDKQEVESKKTYDVTGLEELKDEELDGFIKGLQNRVGKGSA